MARPSRGPFRPLPQRPGRPMEPTDDERALFRDAVADVVPLPDFNQAILHTPKPRPVARQFHRDELAALAASLHAPFSDEDWLDMGDMAAWLRPGVSGQVLKDLKRGRWAIQDHLDLHGLNRHEAHELVGLFLAHCLKEGHRCIRIVHGRGFGSPGRNGVLRGLIKNWLARRIDVLAFCQAPARDGGEGALWVLLKGNRRSTP